MLLMRIYRSGHSSISSSSSSNRKISMKVLFEVYLNIL